MIFKKSPLPRHIQPFFFEWIERLPTSNWQAIAMNDTNEDRGNSKKNLGEFYAFESHFPDTQKKNTDILRFTNHLIPHQSPVLEGHFNGIKSFAGALKKNEASHLEIFHKTNEAFIHQFFKRVRDQLVECGQRDPSGSAFPVDEPKGFEWLRVTFELLTKALGEIEAERNDPKAISLPFLQGLLFCGLHPTSHKFVFRLRLFNLDIEATEDELHCLRVIVFNKKKQENFHGLDPELTMVFRDHKQMVIDLIIKILPSLSKGLLPAT